EASYSHWQNPGSSQLAYWITRWRGPVCFPPHVTVSSHYLVARGPGLGRVYALHDTQPGRRAPGNAARAGPTAGP
nr:hypothetical protein [Tanacetum cinerariifolium]